MPPQASQAPVQGPPPKPSAADPYAAFIAGPLANFRAEPDAGIMPGPAPPMSGFAGAQPLQTPQLELPKTAGMDDAAGAGSDINDDPYAMWRQDELIHSLSRRVEDGSGPQDSQGPPASPDNARIQDDESGDPYSKWRQDALVRGISSMSLDQPAPNLPENGGKGDVADSPAQNTTKQEQSEEPDSSYDPYAMWRKTELVSKLSSSSQKDFTTDEQIPSLHKQLKSRCILSYKHTPNSLSGALHRASCILQSGLLIVFIVMLSVSRGLLSCFHKSALEYGGRGAD